MRGRRSKERGWRYSGQAGGRARRKKERPSPGEESAARFPTLGKLALWLGAAAVAGAFLLLLARSSPELAMVVLAAYVLLAVVAWWERR